MTTNLLFAVLAAGMAPSCEPGAGAGDDGAVVTRAVGVFGATCEASCDGLHCWGSGNGRACHDDRAAYCELHAPYDPLTASRGGD